MTVSNIFPVYAIRTVPIGDPIEIMTQEIEYHINPFNPLENSATIQAVQRSHTINNQITTSDDSAVFTKNGGIDLDLSMLNMRIKRGRDNKPLHWDLQDPTMFDFSGLTPSIIDITLVEDDIFPDISALREEFLNYQEGVNI